jgi:hypothetical protein
MSDQIIPIVVIIVAILVGALISLGRGPNRCAVRPRIERQGRLQALSEERCLRGPEGES